LYVRGAEKDMARLAEFVAARGERIGGITVTLDTHHYTDIAHPAFWRDANGREPSPFTAISAMEVRSGVWTPARPELARRALDYVESLDAGGRYQLRIWPYHCLIGGPGVAVIPALFQALTDWESRFGSVNYVVKGMNPLTEHYSAIRAEVVDPEDAATDTNGALIERLARADLIAVAGEAGSHCVASTIRDLAACAQGDMLIRKTVLIADAVSPVGGFEALQDAMIDEMSARGMQLTTTARFLA
jgi:nicotinamidase-related amidase